MGNATTDTISAPLASKRQVVERLYQYFANAAFDRMADVLHPDIVWVQMEGFPNGGKYKGICDVVTNVFDTFKQEWIGWKSVMTNMVEANDAVFVIGYYSGTYVSTGKSFTSDFIHHYQFNDGKIFRFKQYTDTAQIVKATAK